jgi:hypothetical protein
MYIYVCVCVCVCVDKAVDGTIGYTDKIQELLTGWLKE